MTERERLIEIIGNYDFDATICNLCERPDEDCEKCSCEIFTDYFLNNGVIVPLCNVGDAVWLTLELLKGGLEIVESRCVKITIISDRQTVYSMHINDRAIGNTLEFYDDEFGKTVFLSREEAEKALKERRSATI